MKRTAAYAAANVLAAAGAFITSIVVARGLGITAFGQWTVALAWAGVLTIATDLGFGVLLTRDAAVGQRVGQLAGAAALARTAMLFPAAAIFTVIAPYVGFDDQPLLALAAIATASTAAVYGCIASPLRGRAQSLIPALAIDVAGAALQLGAAWWMVQQRRGPAALLASVGVIQAMQVAAAWVLWRWGPYRNDPVSWPPRAVVAQSLSRAMPFALTGIAANLQLRIAPIMLGALSTAAAVAAFGAAARIGGAARLVPQAGFGGALPVLAEEKSAGSGRLGGRFEGVLAGVAVALGAGIALAAGPLVRWIYGPAFEHAAPVLVWTGIGLVPFLLNSGRRVLLYAAGREREAARWTAAALVLQAVGCAALVPGLGAEGAAIALALGEAAVWWPLRRAPDTHVQTALLSSPRRA